MTSLELKMLRRELKMSYAELSKVVHISVSYLCECELGRKTMSESKSMLIKMIVEKLTATK